MDSETNSSILWFEYLLDSTLLEKQLQQANSENLATELIVEFLLNSHNLNASEKNGRVVDVVAENQESAAVPEVKSRKSLALKILALKCVAHLKWNFQLLENRIPLTIQQLLFQDLLYFVENGSTDIKSHMTINYAESTPHFIFAVSTYHRWVLWALRSIQMITKPNKIIHIPMPGGQGVGYVPPHVTEVLLNNLKMQANDSVIVLEKILKSLNDHKMIMPSINTFVSLTENSNCEIEHNWLLGYAITPEEFEVQLRYDLAEWFMFANQYPSAKHHLQFVGKLFTVCQSQQQLEFCTISTSCLKGFLSACQIQDREADKSLTERMHESIKNQYIGFVNVLQEDNIRQEVPIHYREMAELDLLSAAATGKFTIAKDLVFKVQTLNVVRRILANRHVPYTYFLLLKNEGLTGYAFLIECLEAVFKDANESDKIKIKELILKTNGNSEHLTNSLSKSPLLSLIQGEMIKEEDCSDYLTFQTDFPRTLIPVIECGELILQLIESYRIPEIQMVMDRLSNGLPNKSLWTLYKKWDIPIPFQSAVMTQLPKGPLQDWSYILLAKYRELLSLQDFNGAVEMLRAVEARGREKLPSNSSAGTKLFKLIEWEILLVEIMQFLHLWPKACSSNRFAELTAMCRECLGALQRGETIFPRSEVVDNCVALLLAACEWEFLLALDIRGNNLNVELASSLAAVCYDLQRDRERPTRKISKSLWDIIIPAFNPASAVNSGANAPGGSSLKRSSAGALQQGGSARDSPNANVPLVNRAALSKFCQCLREPQSLCVMLSLFVRLHNVVQDEANLEINSELMSLWPAVLSNANTYHLEAVGEILSSLLEQSLNLYPLNIPWLKLQGDLHFAKGFHSASMSSYLTAASLASDYFHQPIPKQVLDEGTIRRMIKCSNMASCFTQAALLCQFLEEVDYATAFRCLQERTCNDAMDSLYPFIWDVTLLEFIIHLHHKRGEMQRKALALKAVGMLELNSNNNEEILREASALRKAQFLRCLAKQYH